MGRYPWRKGFLPLLIANPNGGEVVNTASIGGLVAGAGTGPYAAPKHAVVGLSKSLHAELALQDVPVGVTIVCPGRVATPITRRVNARPGANPQAVASQHVGDAALGHLHAKLLQLANEALITPPRVLPGQAADQIYGLWQQRGPPRAPVRVGPVPSDQPAVPGQDGLRRDEERRPSRLGDHTGEQGDECSIRPGEARTRDLTAEHGKLVTKDEDLGVVGPVSIRCTRTTSSTRRTSR